MSRLPSVRRQEAGARRAGLHSPTGSGADDGVSTVLGAILMFGLLVVTLVTVQVKFVPVWEKQRESDAALLTTGQLATVKADLDRLTANHTTIPISDPVQLARPQGFTFLQGGHSLPGSMRFEPADAGEGLRLASSQLTIFVNNGNNLYGLGEQWTAVGAGQTLTSVLNILHLRFRIVDPSNAVGSMTFTMTDADGLCAGKIVLVDSIQSGVDNNIEAQIYGPRSPVASTCGTTPITVENWNQKKQLTPTYWYWNALDSNSQFPSVIAAAKFPVTLSLALNGLQGDYTAVYDTNAGGGTVRVGATGIAIPNYNTLTSVGTLSVVLPNQELPKQTYALEYGALFLDQDDGSVMTVAPPFTVAASTTRAQLAWSFPALGGSAAQVTGARSAIVQAAPTGARTFFEAVAPDLTFTIDTPHPALWEAFWDERLRLAGLSSLTTAVASGCLVNTPGPQYSILTTGSTATLVVRGPCPAPTDTTNDLSLTFQQATLAVVLQATG